MSWIWQRLCSGKLWFLRDSCRQCLLAALLSELAWSRSDSPQPENAYGESERLGLGADVQIRLQQNIHFPFHCMLFVPLSLTLVNYNFSAFAGMRFIDPAPDYERNENDDRAFRYAQTVCVRFDNWCTGQPWKLFLGNWITWIWSCSSVGQKGWLLLPVGS